MPGDNLFIYPCGHPYSKISAPESAVSSAGGFLIIASYFVRKAKKYPKKAV
jgi:hypothetical protein